METKKNSKKAAKKAAETTQAEEELSPIETLPQGKLDMVPLGKLFRSTYNPRKRFDEDSLKRLAESIQEKGIIEPLVVRQVANEIASGYEVVAGERRFRAASMVIAPDDCIPVIVRELTDKQALEIAVIENVEREDIDPIEEAGAYKALADMGYKQAEIAARVHRDRSVIANRMRLLELPENVQKMISDGELSPTHGIHLVRYAGFPEVAKEIADMIANHRISVADLDNYLPGAYELGRKGLVVAFTYGDEFEKTVCKQCPFDAYKKFSRGASYCFKPSHYQELADELKQREEAERQEALKEAQALLEKQREEAAAKAQEPAAQDGAAPLTGKPATSKKSKAKPSVSTENAVDLTKLSYNQYTSLQYSTPPPGCTQDCPCRCLGVERNGEIVPVCLQPKRMQALRSAQEKSLRETRREKAEAQRDRTLKRWEKSEAHRGAVLALVPLIWPALSQCSVAEVKLAAAFENISFSVDLSKLFVSEWQRPKEMIRAFYRDLAAYEYDRIFRFAIRAVTNKEVNSAATSGSLTMPFIDWLMEGLKESVPTEPVAAPSDAPAAGQEDSDESWESFEAVRPPEKDGGIEFTEEATATEESPAEPAAAAPAGVTTVCWTCNEPITEEQFDLSCDQAEDGNARCPKCLGDYHDAKTLAPDEPAAETPVVEEAQAEPQVEEVTF